MRYPLHADIPEQKVIFLDDIDPIALPMKAKGVGELDLCGISAAISNATGGRVLDYPIMLDKLINALQIGFVESRCCHIRH